MPMCEKYAAAAAKSLWSCLTLCDPMDCIPPGSSIHGIFQARVLKWGAIFFSMTNAMEVLLVFLCVYWPFMYFLS